VAHCIGLRLPLFEGFTAPGLASLLTGLCVHLLFRTLSSMGMEVAAAVVICLAFGIGLYLLTLRVQGVELRALFRST
jgi:hypothetical protein